ncbi:MAG: S1C family serine protease [Anaerorhabdus sp.]
MDNKFNDKLNETHDEAKGKTSSGKLLKWTATIAIAFFTGFAGSIVGRVVPLQESEEESASAPVVISTESVVTLAQAVYQVAHESVVEIETTGMNSSYSFFGEYVEEGAGSGVIISEDGYIVTNNHVIEDSDQITVILSDGVEYEAQLIGADVSNDLAVIKIEEENLSAVTFGDSDEIVVGEAVLAIGNPLGEFGGSITDGIISATERTITIDSQVIEVLQTNAAVSPGNSGGGLFNSQGELIGIVNAKSSGDDVEGIGFAIPSNDVKDIVTQLIENGYVTDRATLGISISMASSEGALIAEVQSGSAAERAGLRANDLIVAIGGVEIEDYYELKAELLDYNVGDEVEITIIRDNRTTTVTCTLQGVTVTSNVNEANYS